MSATLREREHEFGCRLEVVPPVEDASEFGFFGSGSEEVNDLLEQGAEGFRGDGVFGLQLTELGDEFGKIGGVDGVCHNEN